ncbi:hypothetical protein [Pseudobutyrivibrio ruminis]|uniref:Uncharacterized protein n=1 Tax=Pseudobutyrivibrio ruminis DSM 9787 TaxID=1123011 RepID=A0A285S8Y7_9FIRM|nr:hypothetical protein [Pseudobutyrivibrio ruminis]SOC04060.1 hypothetical protein SAMN02910411_2002 [Pseudobutyrivibrio ruminis DSM 9787]
MKNKKGGNVAKLIFKCALVTVPIWAITAYLATNQMHYWNPEMACLDWNKSVTQNHQDKYYKTIVIGDSASNSAYMPEVISDDMLNLSVLGISTVEGYYILNEYLQNNDAPEDVFLSFSDTHFTYMSLFWDEIMAGHRFSASDSLDIINNVGYEVTENTGVVGAYADYVAYSLYWPSKFMTQLTNSMGEDRVSANEAAVQQAVLHNGRYAYIGNQEFVTVQNKEYAYFGAEDVYVDYLDKTIQLCQKKGINVHIVKIPVPDNAVMTDEYVQAVNDFYQSFVEKYDNVSYNWDMLTCPCRYFADETHLNNDGAYAFSTYIKEIFPEVFTNDTYSSEQMFAIDDTIDMETGTLDLFNLVGERDYTVLVQCDPDQAESLESNIINYGMLLNSLDEEKGLYQTINVNVMDCNYSVDCGDGYVDINGEQLENYHWETDDLIDILVIDNTNNKIVTTKKVWYKEGNGISFYFN